MSRTRIAQIEGRVVESATIYHNHGADDPDGPTLELKFVGGFYFSFSTAHVVQRRANTVLAIDRDGTFVKETRRTFTDKIAAPEEA